MNNHVWSDVRDFSSVSAVGKSGWEGAILLPGDSAIAPSHNSNSVQATEAPSALATPLIEAASCDLSEEGQVELLADATVTRVKALQHSCLAASRAMS